MLSTEWKYNISAAADSISYRTKQPSPDAFFLISFSTFTIAIQMESPKFDQSNRRINRDFSRMQIQVC